MGAVYQAAALSKAFKVKPFVVRDAAVFPIQVTLGLLSFVQGVGHNRLGWEKPIGLLRVRMLLPSFY